MTPEKAEAMLQELRAEHAAQTSGAYAAEDAAVKAAEAAADAAANAEKPEGGAQE